MMMYLLILVFILISNVLSEDCIVEVKESGIYPIKPGDVGMVFYLLLCNSCKEKFYISVKMIQCVEIITEDEQETAAMYLIGGYMGILKKTLKATLIYPNMYLYNRHGTCAIGIVFTDQSRLTRTTRANIIFDTRLRPDGQPPYVIKKFYKRLSRPYRTCDTPDQDPLDKCRGVDCMMKYLGVRNYYNDKWKRCQKVPACVSEGTGDEPDVSYVPMSNRCRNLQNCITENDIGLLEDGLVSNSSRMLSSRGLILRCNHGCMDNNTGTCVCDNGYTSAETDIENYLPGLSVYHMCNIKIASWNEANFPKLQSMILGFAVLAVVITMIILLLTFCLYGLYMYMRAYEVSPFEHSSEDSFGFEDGSECEGALLYDVKQKPTCRSRN